MSKKHVRNASHDLASVELVHRPIPQFHTPQGASVGGDCDEIREKIRSFTMERRRRASSADRWVLRAHLIIDRGIAPAQLPSDNSAPHTADRLRPRLDHRTYAPHERAAGIFPRCWKPSPEPSHPGRLIRRICYAGCAHCSAYVPIACSDCFSLTRFASPLAILPIGRPWLLGD